MSIWMKNKLVSIIVAAVAVFTVAGAGAAWAAQSHNPSSSAHPADGAAQAGSSFEAQGVIQQVLFDQGTTHSGSLTFLPNGKQTTVAVTFTTATEIHIGTAGSSGQGGNASPQATLQAGMTIKVEGTVQADGSLLAREISANAGDANDNDDNNNDQEDQTLTGVIQSVDTSAQTFEFLADGQTAAVTIAYDANTRIEDEHDGDHSGASLAAGARVQVEVVTRADGSLYAKEISPANDNQGDGDDNGGDDHGGNSGPGGGDNGGSGSGHGGGDDSSGSGI